MINLEPLQLARKIMKRNAKLMEIEEIIKFHATSPPPCMLITSITKREIIIMRGNSLLKVIRARVIYIFEQLHSFIFKFNL
jgi:hypothetical protein